MSSPTTPFASTSAIAIPASPAPSSSDDGHPSGPARKRPRTEMTAEERREARAHRNRIAAQNSRDRRKAEFALLNQRVAELEEENRQLRAGMGLAPSSRQADHHERAKWERENEELKERIKSLEQGWDTIVRALAAQGLPTGLPLTAPSSTQPSTIKSEEASTCPSTSFPVLPGLRGIRIRSPPSTGGVSRAPSSLGSPAAGGLAIPSSDQDLGLSAGAHPFAAPAPYDETVPDEAAMEDLLREILAPSPSVGPSPLPTPEAEAPPAAFPAEVATEPYASEWDWDARDKNQEEEMQRLLDMLPAFHHAQAEAAPSLGLDLGGFDFVSTSTVGVF
ncbi:hypothetical protein PUNSTDRAFT_141797 [Punctularia strigosozonata HHB-11173 SS5]|uniref:uncharacterized protein n=1 Tax=Punctularia strigosozonata (strain HHB-11173) TaxID=741275 RepID=UPI0004417EE1|nr:uncharacterized protein PUNSTDRAFT_141797 [Punctularia strigosozonata HHB-11173 SS5]EIN11431.1 hypothetical protein PUNSTDRAFT_141797 [Punctularia strigosozonata HHB-11173 SS5]